MLVRYIERVEDCGDLKGYTKLIKDRDEETT